MERGPAVVPPKQERDSLRMRFKRKSKNEIRKIRIPQSEQPYMIDLNKSVDNNSRTIIKLQSAVSFRNRTP